VVNGESSLAPGRELSSEALRRDARGPVCADDVTAADSEA